jgi:hypothetical protein
LRIPDTKVIPPKVEDVVAADKVEATQAMLETLEPRFQAIKSQSHFLTHEEYDRFAENLQDLTKKLNDSALRKDSDSFAETLASIDGALRSMSEFMAYEEGQGLLATHAESGVRIYHLDGETYLCTPDQKAFSDIAAKDRASLGEFVKAVTGLEIDFSDAGFQSQGNQGGRNLLGCRIDKLALQNGYSEFELRTKVRDPGKDFTPETIRFSLANAASSFGHDKDDNKESIAGGIVPVGRLARHLATGPAIVAKVKTQEARSRRPVGDAPEQVKPAQQKRPTPLDSEARRLLPSRSYTRASQLRDLNTIKAHRQFLRDLDPVDPKIHEKLTTLSHADAQYRKAYNRRLEHLNKQHAKTPTERLAKTIASLESSHADAVLRRAKVLEDILINGADEPTALGVKSRIVELAADVEEAYQTKLRDSGLSADARKTLESSRSQFAERVITHEKSIQNWVRKAYKRATTATAELYESGKRRLAEGYEKFKTSARERVGLGEERARRIAEERLQQTKDLLDTDLDGVKSKKLPAQEKALQRNAETLRTQVEAIEGRVAAGETALEASLKEVKETQAKGILRRKEILERKIVEAGTNEKLSQKLTAELFDELGDEIDAAYRELGQGDSADDFAKQRSEYRRRGEENARYEAHSSNHGVRGAVANRRTVEGLLAKAEPGSRNFAELQAELKVAKTQEKLAISEAAVDKLDRRCYLEPKNEKLRAELDAERVTRDKLRITEGEQRILVSEERLKTNRGRLADIEVDLAKTDLPDAERSRLSAEKEQLEHRVKAGEGEVAQLKAEGSTGQIKRELAVLESELEEARRRLDAEPDASSKAAIEEEIRTKKRSVLEKQRSLMDSELEATRSAQSAVEKQLTSIADELKAIEEQSKAGKLDKSQVERKAQLEKQQKALRGKAKAFDAAVEYLGDQKQLLHLERQIANADANLSSARGELNGLRELDDLNPEQKARVAELEKRILDIEEHVGGTRANLKANQGRVNGKWNGRLKSAIRNFETNTLHRLERMAEKHPARTAIGVAVLAEGLYTAAAADYSVGSRHTILPSLIYMLNEDIEDWDAFHMTVTDSSWSTAQAVAYEGISGGQNALIIGGGLMGLQKVCAMTAGRTTAGQFVGRALASKAAGASLSFAGGVVDGYMTWSDPNTLLYDNDRQIMVKTGSPILMGAAMGSFFGPPGAALGALGGAVGEVAGVTHALMKLDQQIEDDWDKRSVRDSLKLAEKGFVYSEDDSVYLNRKRRFADADTITEKLNLLSENERDVITTQMKAAILGQIFGPESPFSSSELRALGFKTSRSTGSDEAKGRHNWERLGELLESPRHRWVWGVERKGWGLYRYKHKIWQSQSELAYEDSRTKPLMKRLWGVESRTGDQLIDMYNRSMRVDYENYGNTSALGEAGNDVLHLYSFGMFGDPPGTGSSGGVRIHSEMREHLVSVSNDFRSRFAAEEDTIAAIADPAERRARLGELGDKQWQFLMEENPGLADILSVDTSRNMFFDNFRRAQSASGDTLVDLEECAFWKHMEKSSIGTDFMRVRLPDRIVSQVAGNAIDEVRKLSESIEP